MLAPATASAAAAGPTFGAFSAYAAAMDAAGGTVLGLEGDDDAAASALTAALRNQFAARGVGGGKEMSALELKLTMGCDDPPAPGCMAEGGKTLGVDQMVYGKLKKSGAAYTVELTLLDVASGSVAKSLSAPLSADAVASGAVDQTAKDLVDQMLGAEPEPEPEPEVTPDNTLPPPVAAEPEPADDRGGLVWGRHDAAKWKKIGLYTSAGLMVASLGAAVATSLMVRQNGPVYNDLIDAANASLDDDKSGNDINPYTDQDLCDLARTEPPGEMGTVTNAEVANVCRRGDTMATIATATWIGTGVFAVSTIAFTTLLFVHRDKSGNMAKLRRRGASMGVAPMGRGGAMLSGGWRF
ncbi:MAG: hypothetical protein R3A79_24305 [Nannocystaceae bacterium]